MADETRKLGPFRLPALDAPDQDLLAYRDRHFNFFSAYRSRKMEVAARNLFYTLGRHWVELDTNILIDGARGYVFKDMKAPGDVELPKPVTNYIAPAVEVELASLGKRELVPNVIPTSRDPRIEAAAKEAKKILEYRMEKVGWPEVREMATYLTVVCGTAAIKSFWDETYRDLTTIASPLASYCPNCQLKLSSKVVNREQAGMVKSNQGSMVDGEEPDTAVLRHCPECETAAPLLPYKMDPMEAETGMDHFGRPMGMKVPKGNTSLEIVTPFELFPENSGLGVEPDSCKIWGVAKPRTMDWVEERYPDLIEQVEPQHPEEIMKYHPLLGEWQYLGRYNSSLDSNIYDNHVMVYEIYGLPTYKLPLGRRIVIAGDTIVENGELVRHVETTQGVLEVQTVEIAASRFKTRLGEFWGQGLVDNIISPQNRLNGLDSQAIEIRERMGSPNMLVPESADLTGPSFNDGYGSGKLMYWSIDPSNPNAKPEVFGGITAPGGFNEERQATIMDIKQISGPQDIELGEAPRNISTTSGLQLLGEQAERRRAPRERSLVAAFEKIWSHQLRLLWGLRSESDTYEMENEDGSWEERQYDRMTISGQTKVKVEKQAYVDKSLYMREGVREAQADGLYRLDSQAAIKKMLELRNLPTDVNEDLNQQVDRAKEQWTDFVDGGIVPVIDPSLHDARIRYQVLGTFLLTDEGHRIENDAGWPGVLKAIAGWEEQLAQAEAMDAQVKAFYGGVLPPDQAAEAYARAMADFTIQKSESEKINMQQQELAAKGLPSAPVPPPMEPPPPVFLPQAIEDKILMVWMKLLEQKPETLHDENFLKFRAVVDGYKILAERKEMAMAGGMASGAPAPGTPPGSPGVGGATPGLQFSSPPNPPTPPTAPGVGGNAKGGI